VIDPVLAIAALRVALPAWSDRPLAVDGVSLAIERNEILCVVGESGSGKSVMAKSILGLLPAPHVRVIDGAVHFEGRDLLAAGEEEMLAIRGGRISMIFQEPMVALNPLMKVGGQIDEVFRVHTGLGAQARRRRVVELFSDVHLPEPERITASYPHELSGGEQQRVALARALATGPAVMLLDEPFSGLDRRLRAALRDTTVAALRASGAAALIVTHDAGEALGLADAIALMSDGRIIQAGAPDAVYMKPNSLASARILGDADFLPARLENGLVVTALGAIDSAGFDDSEAVAVLVRPEGIRIAAPSEKGASATVLDRRPAIGFAQIACRLDDGLRLRARVPLTNVVREGDRIRLALNPAYAHPVNAALAQA